MRRLTFKNAFLVSGLLHFVAGLWLFFSQYEPKVRNPETVTIDYIENAETAREKVPDAKQIVEQDEKSLNNEKPLKEAYLSATDQRVEKETVAQERGDFRNRKDRATQTGQQASAPQKQEKLRPSLRELMGNDPIAQLQRNEEWMNREEQQGQKTAAASAEASQTNDYLKDVAPGGETLLNTREFKYYTYYSRIRRQLSQHWQPQVRTKLEKMFRQGRRIASDKDHVTKLLITLDQEGLLVKVQVLTESGVADLDQAATDAFRAAAPFPNPPKGIIESDGTVKIRWDFILES